MMSSSDDLIENNYVQSKWEPLVPGELERSSPEHDDIDSRKDPELERAFKELYTTVQSEKRHFSLLYDKPEEEVESDDLTAIDEEHPDSEDEQPLEPVENEVELPDVEAIKEEAYKEGFSKGEAEGYEAGILSANEKTERLALILNGIETLWTKLLNNNEEKIIGLVAKIAEKVVYGSVAVDNTIITRAILDIFEKIPNPVNATITVNPADYEYIEVVKEDFFEEIRGLKQVSIVSDQLIEAGGCRIETSAGEVDTSIDERLEAVKRSVINIATQLK